MNKFVEESLKFFLILVWFGILSGNQVEMYV